MTDVLQLHDDAHLRAELRFVPVGDEINLGRFGDALADGGQAVEAATSDFNLDGIAKLTKPWCSKYGILLIKLLVLF